MTQQEYNEKMGNLIKEKNQVKEKYLALLKRIEEKIIARINGFNTTNHRTRIYINFSSYYSSEITLDVNFVNEENDKDYFGSNFRVYFDRKKDYEMSISSGTIGTYTRSQNPDQIWRISFINSLWEHETILTDLIREIFVEIPIDDFERNYHNLESEIQDLEWHFEQEKEQNIRNNLAVGQTYDVVNENFVTSWLTITKICTKNIYYEYTFKCNTTDTRTSHNNKARIEDIIYHIKRGAYKLRA